MNAFIGEYSCRLDAKGRVVFPSGFKKQLPATATEKFVVKKDIFEKCLVLYTMTEWERQNKLIRSKINPYNKEHNRFLREFFRGAAELELDSNNRLLLPKRLLDQIEAEKEVVMAGQAGRIEIWSKTAYQSVETPEDDFADLAEKILGSVSFNDDDD